MRETELARGGPTHGPSAMALADRSRFLDALDRAIQAARRGPEKPIFRIPPGGF
jgi:uncharacterized protein YaiI (UPF0178 family)